MDTFTQNDALNYFFGAVVTLFSAGSPTATVYTDKKQEADVNFNVTNRVDLRPLLEINREICGNNGIWSGYKEIIVEAIIISNCRDTAYKVWDRLELFLAQGQFQDTAYSPLNGPSTLMYTELNSVRNLPVEGDDLYALQVNFTVFFYRTMF
jgi:hypothetical protein